MRLIEEKISISGLIENTLVVSPGMDGVGYQIGKVEEGQGYRLAGGDANKVEAGRKHEEEGGDGIVKEGNGEDRGDQLPGDGVGDGSNDGDAEAKITT